MAGHYDSVLTDSTETVIVNGGNVLEKYNYLSTVFLDAAGPDYTEDKVMQGIQACEEILNERLKDTPSGIGCVLYFFLEDDGGMPMESSRFREMMDLWDVLQEFDEPQYQGYDILKMCKLIHSLAGKRGQLQRIAGMAS